MWAEPIKSKEGAEVAKVLRGIFQREGESPNMLSVDFGKEYLNKKVAELLRELRIQLVLSHSAYKAMQCESAIRSLRGLLRRMKASKSHPSHWPKLLKHCTETMNSRKSRLTGLAPNQINANNAAQVFSRLYPTIVGTALPPLTPKFAINDTVRVIQAVANIFTKGAKRTPSSGIYKIARILFHPIQIEYRVKEVQSGNLLPGKFSEQDLVAVKLPLS